MMANHVNADISPTTMRIKSTKDPILDVGYPLRLAASVARDKLIIRRLAQTNLSECRSFASSIAQLVWTVGIPTSD